MTNINETSQRFSALLLTVALTLTQAIPAFALRIEQDTEGPKSIRAGLEEVPKARPIGDILSDLGILPDEVEPYGRFIAKIRTPEVLERLRNQQPGKLVIVTGMTPTPAGEGKTTTSIGLADGLRVMGVPAIAALREPSLGPVFGAKGGATGADKAQLVPAQRINLAFTGDFTAVSDAHNLLVETVYNQIYHRQLPFDLAGRVALKYVMDLNARALRDIKIKVGREGVEQEQGFILTPASEVMAILALAHDREDLRKRLERIVVAWRPDGAPVTAREIGVVGNMVTLLQNAMMPNLVQSSEGNPVLEAIPILRIQNW